MIFEEIFIRGRSEILDISLVFTMYLLYICRLFHYFAPHTTKKSHQNFGEACTHLPDEWEVQNVKNLKFFIWKLGFSFAKYKHKRDIAERRLRRADANKDSIL